MVRARKEGRDEAIARANKAEADLWLHRFALDSISRDGGAGVQWFENGHFRIGLCPEQPASGQRPVVIFEKGAGRQFPDGTSAGSWRAEWYQSLLDWRKSIVYLTSDESRAMCELLDEVHRALWEQSVSARAEDGEAA